MATDDDAETSTEFATSAEGANAQIDRDDQAVAVEIKTSYPHKARHDGVVVMPDLPSDKIGRIILPDGAKNPPLTGRVLAIGPKVGSDLKVGQRVAYSKHSGTEIEVKFQGRAVVLLRDEQVRMILSPEG